MIRFSPQWTTPAYLPLDSTPLAEGDLFSYTLLAQDVGTVSVASGPTVEISLGSPAELVSSVYLNGTLLEPWRISKSNKNIFFDLADLSLPQKIVIELHRDTPVTYSILYGALPAGLAMSSSGEITGQVGNVPGSETTSFAFTVRASNGSQVGDRQFTIRAMPTERPTEWVPSGLPVPIYNADVNADIYHIGTLKRADSISMSLEATDADEVISDAEIRPTGFSGSSFIEGLPPNLRLQDRTITGMIDPKAPAGRYLFRIGFVGQTSNSIIGEIVVLDALSMNFEQPTIIEWITDAGSLGEIVEALPSNLGVRAKHNTSAITYTLSPGSTPLPVGLSVNIYTGDIEGIPSYVDFDTTYSFKLRAGAGENYIDREFSITVKSRYSTSDVLDLRLRLPNAEKFPMVARYDTLINSADVFRGDDVHYGIPREPTIYLIKGLASGDLFAAISGDGSVGVGGIDYHGSIDLLFGPHKHAVMRDSNGRVFCEVIYREVIDPQARAGGFSFATNTAVEEKVIYSQSPSPKYVFPRSLRNARMDLIRHLGFATTDPALLRLPGPQGVEALPYWMASPQIEGDPNSVLGYTAGLVVAHVQPGRAKAIIKTLDGDSMLFPNGKQMRFDRFYTFTIDYRETTIFDDDTTNFDGVTTPAKIGFDFNGVATGASIPTPEHIPDTDFSDKENAVQMLITGIL